MQDDRPSLSFSLLSRSDYLFLFSLVSILILISQINYLLFHSLVEISIATTGFITFAFTWHLRRFELGSLLVIGILLGCTAAINVLHMLAFKGMGVLGGDANLPTQLWIAGRYFFSSVLLIFLSLPLKKINPYVLLYTLGTLTVFVVLLVFSGNFPVCFDPLTGQTEFKITSEYIISVILMISALMFWKKRGSFPSNVTSLILIFFWFSILTELVFTTYLSVYDISNMLGHIFQFVSSYFLYKAIVETGLEKPFDLMFKNLNEAVIARDEFISLASHELKTPLTPLKLQLQMFQREFEKSSSDDSKILKVTRSSNEQVDRLSRLIDGMLDVSRLSTGQFEIFRENVELSSLITSLIKRFDSQVVESNTDLSLKIFQHEIHVDPMRTEQVISNLLMNALKYAPGSKIEIGFEKHGDDKTKIWVSDTGPGISPEVQEKIFNRYERVSSKTTVGGLGLGLYISRQIIETHGGTLTLESDLNKGSRFIILI